jgi:two-component system sensor histidine kinase BaeS
MRRIYLALLAVLFGLALFEVTMRPSREERLELTLIFLLMAVVIVGAGQLLPRVARRVRSLRLTVVILATTSFLIVAGGAIAVAQRMFISEHDLALLLVVLGFGVVAALGFAVLVSRPLTADVNLLSESTSRVAAGDLDIRLDLERRDEVGRLGVAIDQMISGLSQVAAERVANAEARRAFFAAIGHDLRTPLASLRAAVEAMQDGLAGDTGYFLASMEEDVTALSHLVNDLFLLARLDSGVIDLTRSGVEMSETIDEAIDVLKPVAEQRGVTLRHERSDRVIALGNGEALARVLRNVIENAIRHAPEESDVSIDVMTDTDSVTVYVRDGGIGFAPDFVGVAFDHFTREDPSRGRATGGSGLGLAIAGGLVTALDGQIWAEPGPGGTVGFSLPRLAPASRPESSRRVPSGTG